MTDYKQYLPLAIIGVGALYAIKKLSENSGRGQIINRAIDYTQAGNTGQSSVVDNPTKLGAFNYLSQVALGAQNLQSRKDVSLAAIDLEKVRAESAFSLGKLQNETTRILGVNNLEAEKSRYNAALEAARLDSASRQYDANQQAYAINRILQSQRRPTQSASSSNIPQDVLSALLQGINNLLNRKPSPATTPRTPPFNPATGNQQRPILIRRGPSAFSLPTGRYFDFELSPPPDIFGPWYSGDPVITFPDYGGDSGFNFDFGGDGFDFGGDGFDFGGEDFFA